MKPIAQSREKVEATLSPNILTIRLKITDSRVLARLLVDGFAPFG